MKKLLTILALSIVCAFCAIGFTACDTELQDNNISNVQTDNGNSENGGNSSNNSADKQWSDIIDESRYGTYTFSQVTALTDGQESVFRKGETFAGITLSETTFMAAINSAGINICGFVYDEENNEMVLKGIATCGCNFAEDEIIVDNDKLTFTDNYTICNVGFEGNNLVVVNSDETSDNTQRFVFEKYNDNGELEYDNALYIGTDDVKYLLGAKSRYITSCQIHPKTKIINKDAFANCNNVREIFIPSSVEIILDGAFHNEITPETNTLETVTFGENSALKRIGDSAFARCSNLMSIVIPDSVETIGEWAFADCSSLVGVTIGNGVTSIGEKAFYDCDSLTSIKIPDSVTNIGNEAFDRCDNLQYTEYENGFYLGNDANPYVILFATDDSHVEYFVIHENTKVIYSGAVWCKYITSVTIPNSVISIGKWAFYGCYSLENIIFENTAGWSVNGNAISSKDLANTETAARFLNDEYGNCVWTRGINADANDDNDDNEENQTFFTENDYGTYEFIQIVVTEDGQETVVNKGDKYDGMIVNEMLYINSDGIFTVEYTETEDGEIDAILCRDVLLFADGRYDIQDNILKSGIQSLYYENGNLTYYKGYQNDFFKIIYEKTDSGIFEQYDNGFYLNIDGVKYFIRATSRDITECRIHPDTDIISNTEGAHGAFEGCSKLTSITIPDSVTSIGQRAFQGCSSLTSVVFGNPDGWTYDGNAISSEDLANPETAAQYLTADFYNYTWERTTEIAE